MKNLDLLHDKFLSKAVDGGELLELFGWLVIIDYSLFLIPCEYGADYRSGEKIEFCESEVIFSIADKVLPLGGGDSFIFHKAKVLGRLMDTSPPKVSPVRIVVEDRSLGSIEVCLEDEAMDRNKIRYSEFLKNRGTSDSADWLDIYKG
ncbi:hypothetical protein I9018_00885 [Pseudomonas sp. MPFS]|uniref:hypothetical protein n=1 Tax=Pseudomonas sp. MPFS TaxID=2795724 RepID=UPI001F141D1E|nr:hypothetical protein [Pseudomonas sp. MPFS]UMZ12296.1 hypothetical protein I9018_00885 [Pseudomonas sp. MPFS]